MAAILFFEPLALGALGLIFLVWARRIISISRYRRTHPPLTVPKETLAFTPKISVIIPAKDEEKNITNCLEHLLKQDYPNYEIIVVDDRSTDQTRQIIDTYSARSSLPIHRISVDKLPEGWTGKNYAMFTGSRKASGEWLLFTDADTTHTSGSLRSSIACALRDKIDLLTLAPRTETRSFWEKTVQPVAVGSLAIWFNPDKINDPKSKLVLANGQYILIGKGVYEAVGGNESIRSAVVEDVELAKRTRAAGFIVKFLNGTDLYSTRMYSSLREIIRGWTRILTHLFNKNILSVAHKIFLFIFFSCLPFLILLVESVIGLAKPAVFSPDLFLISLAVSGFIVMTRFIGNKILRTNPWYSILHLLGSLVMIWILTVCLFRIIFDRPSNWRGDLHR